MVSRKQKKIDSLKRREAFREPRKSILIVCEGSKTEPLYFNLLQKKLRLKMADVEIAHKDPAPITVINHAIKLRNKRKDSANDESNLTKVKYDEVYCVMDIDKHESLTKAINKAKDHKLKIILSNPCFEYWYILHFIKTSSPFHSSRNVISEVKKYHTKYSKGDVTIFDVIFNKTSKAIKRSKEVIREQHNNAVDLQNCNPSTNVHLIVEELLKMVQNEI